MSSTVCNPTPQPPSLHDVAGYLLLEQWYLREIKEPDPSALKLYRTDASGKRHIDELVDVLIECGLENTSLSLDVDTDYLSFFKGVETPFRSRIAIGTVQALINESAPYLLPTFQQALHESRAAPRCEHPIQQLRQQLPAWLAAASGSQRRDYAARLLRLARLQERGGTPSFLDGVPDALDFAREKLLDALHKEHPYWPAPDLDDLQLVNRQVTAATGGSGGDVVPGGEVQVVRMSPMQFALANLAVLRVGSVHLRSRSGAYLPDWLSVDYLKDLVSRLDIGGQYPAVLQRLLLDDRSERERRQKCFVQQISEQVPLLALETCLRDPQALGAESVRRLDELFRPAGRPPREVVIRPLTFIARAGASADVANNAWLVEAPEIDKGPCLLYRPLHRQPLLEFVDRKAFFTALCATGDLQDDILGRLPAARQPIYANGGFAEPHVVRFFPGDEFSMFEVPALARLGKATLQGNVPEQLYQSCARELIDRARHETLSSSASRWLGYEELGWLMFNTMLPFFNGPLVKAAWMLPLFASLRQVLAAPEEKEQPADLRELLLNLAFLLLPESEGKHPALPDALEPSRDVSRWPGFGWASTVLDDAQRKALKGFRRQLDITQLGQPEAAGVHQGLYRYEQHWWVLIEGAIYQLALGDDGLRLVDADGNLGPWIRDEGGGDWQLDLGLRLHGGMPVNRRIAQLRENNRQRLIQLAEKHSVLLAQRKAVAERVTANMDEAAALPQPTTAVLEKYLAHLREQDRLLVEFDDNFCQLHQLQPQSGFKRIHSRDLYDRAATQAHLAFVLRSRLSRHYELLSTLQLAASAQDEHSPEQKEKMRQVTQECLAARGHIDELLACHAVVADVRRQLRNIQPAGPKLAELAGALLDEEPGVRSWKSVDLSLRTALVLAIEQRDDRDLLYGGLLTARTALSMRDSLEVKDAFAEAEQIEVLDSIVDRLGVALNSARLYRTFARSEQGNAELDGLRQLLEQLYEEAREELAGRLKMQPTPAEPAPKPGPARRKQVLIRTRDRGVVVGERRKAEGDRPEKVVVADPIDHSDLVSFEESAEPGVWQAVVAEPSKPLSPTPASLATLLKRATPLLNNADRRLAKVRSYAKTASVGADIEDLMNLEARPLDALAQQIQDAVVRENALEDAAEAARQRAALSERAKAMREEGRRLRVDILKKQAPTVGHLAWLLDQGEVSIAREGQRVALAKRKGLPQDYLQEFVVRDKTGEPLWYAHFHYASAEATDFTVAHLKTQAQRYERGQQQSNQALIEVYRSRIDKGSAQKLFSC